MDDFPRVAAVAWKDITSLSVSDADGLFGCLDIVLKNRKQFLILKHVY